MVSIISKSDVINCASEFTLINLNKNLGDIIACEPIIRHLKAANPDQLLVWSVYPQYYEALISHPGLDSVVFMDHLHDSYLFSKHLPDNCNYINLNLHNQICQKTCQPIPNNGNDKIDISNYLFHGSLTEIYTKIGGIQNISDTVPRFYILPFIKPPSFLPPRYVVFHCKTNDKIRDWPKESWAALTGILISSGFNVVEVGLEPIARPSSNFLYGYYDLTNMNHIQQIAAVINKAYFFIGVESSFAHVASALNVNGLIIMGRLGPYILYNTHSGLYSSPKHQIRAYFRSASSISVKKVARMFFNKIKHINTQ
jgi:heptosyltransferase-3